MKQYIIYKTTNQLNNMFYVGVHMTNNINDNYLGSGTRLLNAIRIHGRDMFTREILFYCSSEEEMYYHEKLIVNEEFILNPLTYNIKLGGSGGYKGCRDTPKIMKNETKEKLSIKAKERFKNNPGTFSGKTHSIETKEKMKIKQKERFKNNPGTFSGKTHSIETKEKMSTFKKNNPSSHNYLPIMYGIDNNSTRILYARDSQNIYYTVVGINKFCKEHNLRADIIKKYIDISIIPDIIFERPYQRKHSKQLAYNCTGWYFSTNPL